MLSVSNYDFISDYNLRFAEFVEAGGRMRYIIIHPYGNAIVMAADRAFFKRDIDHLRTLIILCLQSIHKFIAVTPKNNVEIKVIDQLPGATITMIDHQTPRGVIFVTLPGFKQFSPSRPSFVLYKDVDEKWFSFYQTYFENIWNWDGAEPFDPAKHLPPLNLSPQSPTPNPDA